MDDQGRRRPARPNHRLGRPKTVNLEDSNGRETTGRRKERRTEVEEDDEVEDKKSAISLERPVRSW